ncbi:hypothetical protein [Streptomyces sp. NPDC002994]|uniref:hypothetical protein n=1 Tax=Streptomyces sp. NPDC002994 TaxID=3154441 RepID=UPI0033B97136
MCLDPGRYVRDADHWVVLEKAEEVADLTLRFFRARARSQQPRVTCDGPRRWQVMKNRSAAAAAVSLVAGLAAALAGPAQSAHADPPDGRPAGLLTVLPDVGEDSFQDFHKAIHY